MHIELLTIINPAAINVHLFIYYLSPHPRRMLRTIQLTAVGCLVWICAGTMDDIATRKQILHALAASCGNGSPCMCA